MGGLDSKRFEIWSHVFALVDMPHFLIGKGAGWFPDLKMAFHGKVALQEHNELITIFNIFGIVGLGAFIVVLKKAIPREPKDFIFPAILFACFFNFFGHFTLHRSTTAIVFIVTAAICLAQNNREHHVYNF